jgi:hypothetical protein
MKTLYIASTNHGVGVVHETTAGANLDDRRDLAADGYVLLRHDYTSRAEAGLLVPTFADG